jgi:hypothetical protein
MFRFYLLTTVHLPVNLQRVGTGKHLSSLNYCMKGMSNRQQGLHELAVQITGIQSQSFLGTELAKHAIRRWIQSSPC